MAAARRSDDVQIVVAKNVMRIPNSKGYIFNITWGKSLRDGSVHVFGLMCSCDKYGRICVLIVQLRSMFSMLQKNVVGLFNRGSCFLR